MIVSPIQILLTLFLGFAISRVYLRAREGTIRFSEMCFWGSIFTLALVGVVDPNFTTYIASILGIGRGADVVVYISLALVFYLIFRLTVAMENIRHEITTLVRTIALLKTSDKDEKKTSSSSTHSR